MLVRNKVFLNKAYFMLSLQMSQVALQESENFVELDRFRRDRAYLTLILLTWRTRSAPNTASKWQMGFNSAFKVLILHVHKTENTNRLILKLQENCEMQFYVFLPQCYNGQFSALDIFEINTKKRYYKLLHLGRCFCSA